MNLKQMHELSYKSLAALPTNDKDAYRKHVAKFFYELFPNGTINIMGCTFKLQYGTDTSSRSELIGINFCDELGILTIEPVYRQCCINIDTILSNLWGCVLSFIDKTLHYRIIGNTGEGDTNMNRSLNSPVLIAYSYSLHKLCVENNWYDLVAFDADKKPTLQDFLNLKKVRVGSFDYDIVHDRVTPAGSSAYGDMCPAFGEIQIYSGDYGTETKLTPAFRAQTLLHEILHAVDYECGEPFFKETCPELFPHETRINVLSIRLLEFFLANNFLLRSDEDAKPSSSSGGNDVNTRAHLPAFWK